MQEKFENGRFTLKRIKCLPSTLRPQTLQSPGIRIRV